MNKAPSKSTILIIAVALIFTAYALGLLDPAIEWAEANLTLEGQTQGMIEQILR